MSDRPRPLRPVRLGGERRAPTYVGETDAAAVVDTGRTHELAAIARDRQHRRRVLAGAIVAVVLAALVGAAVAVITVDVDRPPRGPAVERPFDALGAEGAGIPGAAGAAFSPDGTRLAVRLGGGVLGLAEGGLLRRIVPDETQVVAFAWYGTSRLLVQEGPVSTAQLAIVDVDGADRGVVPLAPDVPPGNGLALSPDATRVVLVSFGSVDFAGQSTPVDLFIADLPSGATRPLTESPDLAESDPLFLDRDTVVAVQRSATGADVVAIDVTTGKVRPLAPATPASRLLGRRGPPSQTEVLWSDGRDLRATSLDGASRRVGSVPAGTSAVAVDPAGQRLIVRETSEDGADSRLRMVRLAS